MDKLNSIPNIGKWSIIAALLNENSQKIENELTRLGLLSYRSSKFKGYFATYDLLESEYPIPEVGDWAFVGNVIYQYAYESDNGNAFWEEGADVNTVFGPDLANYISKEEYSKYILPFDGVTTSTKTIENNSTISDKIDLYYLANKERFAALDRNNLKFYGGWLFGEDDATSYNDKNKLYIDSDGNIFRFVGDKLTKIIQGEIKYTTSAKANKAVKELYIKGIKEGGFSVNDFYIGIILKNYGETNVNYNYKCQISIYFNGALVAEAYDRSMDEHEPNSIMKVEEMNNSGISGYIVTNWEVVDSQQWYAQSVDGNAYLTSMVLAKEFSPIIYSYLSNVESLSYTEEEVEL